MVAHPKRGAAGLEPSKLPRMKFESGMIDRFDDPTFINEVWRPFFDWVEVNYPDDIPIMFRYHSDGTPYVGLAFMTKQIYPSFVSDESVELWRERTAQYISEVTG